MNEIPFQPCPELCTVLPLTLLRKTPGVTFDSMPTELIEKSSGGERVIHQRGAISPGPVGEVLRPWYCHRFQDDHLMVLHGSRTVELWHSSAQQVYSFYITADSIYVDDELLYEGGAILRWKAGVFHRIESSKEIGSASFNFAIRREGFDIRREFDIYNLNVETGQHQVIRAGYKDQTTP